MKFYLKLLLALTLLVSTSGLAAAQSKEERAASGNSGSVSATSRVDAINKQLNVFINAQSAQFTGTATNIRVTHENFITQIGLLTQALGNVGTSGACTPGTGIHGCKPQCACSVNGKILWTGNKWQCYQAQYQCPQGQSYNAETCKCGPSNSCNAQTPPQTCPVGKKWDPRTCTCCENCDTGDCPAGQYHDPAAVGCGVPSACICDAYIVSQRADPPRHPTAPYVGFPPGLEDYLVKPFQNDAGGCPVNLQCKDGMTYGYYYYRTANGQERYNAPRKCCCAQMGQKYSRELGRCGDVCPQGWMLNNMETACFKPQYFSVTGSCPSDSWPTGNNANTCAGASGTCCYKDSGVATQVTDFTFGDKCVP